MSKKSLKHEELEIKVILVGNIHVGKTSILNKTMGIILMKICYLLQLQLSQLRQSKLIKQNIK